MVSDDGPSELGTGPEPTDAEIESEVSHLVKGLVQVVATREFVETHADLIREVEELQLRVWLQEERRHLARFPPSRTLGAPLASTTSSAPAGRTRPKPVSIDPSTLRPPRGGRRLTQKVAESDAELSALQKQLELAISGLGGSSTDADDQCRNAAAGSAGGGVDVTGVGGGSSSGSGGAAGGSMGGSAATGARRTRGGGGGGSKPPPSVPAVAQCSSAFASCAEALLPAAPSRSQFVFETPNPLMMHSASEEQRHLQRRLSMLGAMQAETIKLERKQRADGRSMSSMFYKLGASNGTTAASAPQSMQAAAAGGVASSLSAQGRAAVASAASQAALSAALRPPASTAAAYRLVGSSVPSRTAHHLFTPGVHQVGGFPGAMYSKPK